MGTYIKWPDTIRIQEIKTALKMYSINEKRIWLSTIFLTMLMDSINIHYIPSHELLCILTWWGVFCDLITWTAILAEEDSSWYSYRSKGRVQKKMQTLVLQARRLDIRLNSLTSKKSYNEKQMMDAR